MLTQLEIISAPRADTALARRLRDWFEQEFGPADRWAAPDYFAICRANDELAGRVGILDRKIIVGGRNLRVGGIGGVVTRPEFRHRRVATAMLLRAAEFMRGDLGLEFGLLLCRPEVSPVYAKLGWMRVDGRTTYSRSGKNGVYPDFTMILPLGSSRWPGGEIDLMGLPW